MPQLDWTVEGVADLRIGCAAEFPSRPLCLQVFSQFMLALHDHTCVLGHGEGVSTRQERACVTDLLQSPVCVGLALTHLVNETAEQNGRSPLAKSVHSASPYKPHQGVWHIYRP